jgi:hypothetical protein
MAMRAWAQARLAVIAGMAVSLLAACGGGIDSVLEDDERNGEYVMYAADAKQYTLTMDFDKREYRVQGNGVDQSGKFGSDENGGFFATTSVGTGFNTARFRTAEDAVLGGFRFGQTLQPFVAARDFVTTLADAAGTYNFLSRTVDSAAAPNTAIFQGQLTAAGQLRTCMDLVIHRIEDCPSASVVTGTVTVSGNQFTATTPGGAFPFRIARIGNDKVFLRASVSTATASRFWVGVPAAAFASGAFSGVNTDNQYSRFSLAPTSHTATLTTASGATLTRSGNAQALGSGSSGLPGILALTTASSGNYFAIRTGELAMIVASRDSTVAPGFVEIGRTQ